MAVQVNTMKILNLVSRIIIAIAGLNLGSIGVFDYDFLWTLSGESEFILRAFYVLVGLATLLLIVKHFVKKPVVTVA